MPRSIANNDNHEIREIGDLHATFCQEVVIYFRSFEATGSKDDFEHSQSVAIRIEQASSISGGKIVSTNQDVTGIMVWPATHLLCQHVIASEQRLGNVILELGCGCGLVGIAAFQTPDPPSVWISTDMDDRVLQLCRHNFYLNGLEVNSTGSRIWTQSLRWGDAKGISRVLDKARQMLGSQRAKFDTIVAADIVYPSTCGSVLHALFETVDQLLEPEGTFWLSFASRDGPRTPSKLIAAATIAGFAIDCLPPVHPSIAKQLPPLLDSKILLLHRRDDNLLVNSRLGSDKCKVFPGLKTQLSRLESLSDRDETWDAPFASEDFL